MISKLLSFIYLVFLLLIGIFALSLGSSNDIAVEVNLLFVTASTSLSIVIACSILGGFVFAFLIAFYIYIKQWLKYKHLLNKQRSELMAQIRSDEEKLSKAAELVKEAENEKMAAIENSAQ